MSDRRSVVLLGDSIFDNLSYTRGGPDVVRQLGEALPEGWRAVLAAVDGAVMADVPRQLRDVPDDAAVLALSAGGNDLLGHMGVLQMPARSSAEVLGHLADLADGFERGYRAMLAKVLDLGLPTIVCTVYNGQLGDDAVQRRANVGMAVFDDRIVRLAAEHGLPVIDLRAVCSRPEDYANPIEPSSVGGEKIARAIARVALEHDFGRRESVLYLR